MKTSEHSETRKITAILPKSLLESAMRGTGLGVTETLSYALRDLNHKLACQSVRSLRGKLKLGMTYDQLKAERE